MRKQESPDFSQGESQVVRFLFLFSGSQIGVQRNVFLGVQWAFVIVRESREGTLPEFKTYRRSWTNDFENDAGPGPSTETETGSCRTSKAT